jgi:hypothetical protein
MKRIYVAGWPDGQLACHLSRAEAALRTLADAGLAPFVPSFYLYASGPRVFGTTVYTVARPAPPGTGWPHVLLPWLRSAEAVLRLDSDSTWESRAAEILGIPVFDEADDVIEWAEPEKFFV